MQKQPSVLPPKEVKFCRLDLPPEFPITLMWEDKWYSSFQAITMVHFHNCLQVGYCESGKGYYLVDGSLHPYRKDCISLVPPKSLHFCASQLSVVSRWKWLYLDPTGLLNRHISPASAKMLGPLLYGKVHLPCILSSSQSPQAIRIVQSIIFELENRQPQYKETVCALTEAFIQVVMRMSEEPSTRDSEILPASLQLITPAIEWISMHYMDPVTVPQLAQLCHISTTHLRRLFQTIMNCSPLEYLQGIRLEAACGMLLYTDHSVLDIGNQAGFATPTSFTRQFKKQYGTTPGQWRIKMTRKKQEH